MIDKIEIKPSEIKNISSKFSKKSYDIRRVLASLNKEMNILSNAWEGESKKSFINKFNLDKKKINDLANSIDEISRDLNNIAKSMEDLDRKLGSIL